MRHHHITSGAARAAAVHRARELRASGMTWQAVGAEMVDVGATWQAIRKWCESVADIPQPTAADLASKHFKAGRPRAERFGAPEITAIKSASLDINGAWNRTSTHEAIRLAARDGGLDGEVFERMLEREAEGKPMLTPAQRRDARVSETEIRHVRGARDAWLDYVSNPGALAFYIDEEGNEVPYGAGHAITIDDGSVNLMLTVPLVKHGDPCYDAFQVCLGRFQLLLTVDHATRYVLGFAFTARPRDSYRAEDILACLHKLAAEHGLPKEIILERGISAANSITEAMRLAGVRIVRAMSPHQKVVESVFNRLWTKLSHLKGQVGRSMGEDDRCEKLIRSCREGATDPRKHFLSLKDVEVALVEAIAEHNAQRCNSARLGHWIPAERWARESVQNLRRIPRGDDWHFAPCVKQVRVRGFNVATSVRYMPGHSVLYTFNSDALHRWTGADVNLHFNPFATDVVAKVVLARDFKGHRAGTIIGDAKLADRYAKNSRRAFAYGDDRDEKVSRSNAQALHNSVVAMRPDGSRGVRHYEVRDGLGSAAAVTIGDTRPQESESAPSDSRLLNSDSSPTISRAGSHPEDTHHGADPAAARTVRNTTPDARSSSDHPDLTPRGGPFSALTNRARELNDLAEDALAALGD